ncbi:hypothetical protein [Pontibacter sp. H249]|uniref:hypothetical protein n=1 Tax=Pontibacter sp. H249 TaxID=3133420 RepID=UPI0030C38915
MQKITIKELVAFRRKADRSKKNFAFKLKTREAKVKTEADAEGGGDYWVTSTSCIYNVFKHKDTELYNAKIDELRAKLENAEDKRTKAMYQRNMDILTSFKDFEFDDVKPSGKLIFQKVPKVYKIHTLDGFPLFVNPSLMFSYDKNGKNELGAVWLIPQLDGFRKYELGMFSEMLYRFLQKNYADDYQISQDHCIAIDTFNAQAVTYTDLLKGDVPHLIDSTLKEIREL